MAKSKKKPEISKQTTSEATKHYNIYGYQDADEVALDISSGIHSSLLKGYFVFAYRGSGDLRRLVVTRTGQDTWMYGIITPGWTELVSRINQEGLLEMCVSKMETCKIPINIIDDFKYFISQ